MNGIVRTIDVKELADEAVRTPFKGHYSPEIALARQWLKISDNEKELTTVEIPRKLYRNYGIVIKQVFDFLDELDSILLETIKLPWKIIATQSFSETELDKEMIHVPSIIINIGEGQCEIDKSTSRPARFGESPDHWKLNFLCAMSFKPNGEIFISPHYDPVRSYECCYEDCSGILNILAAEFSSTLAGKYLT